MILFICTKFLYYEKFKSSDGQQFHQYQQNQQSPLTEHEKGGQRWKSRSWLETGTKNVTLVNWLHIIRLCIFIYIYTTSE